MARIDWTPIQEKLKRNGCPFTQQHLPKQNIRQPYFLKKLVLTPQYQCRCSPTGIFVTSGLFNGILEMCIFTPKVQ